MKIRTSPCAWVTTPLTQYGNQVYHLDSQPNIPEYILWRKYPHGDSLYQDEIFHFHFHRHSSQIQQYLWSKGTWYSWFIAIHLSDTVFIAQTNGGSVLYYSCASISTQVVISKRPRVHFKKYRQWTICFTESIVLIKIFSITIKEMLNKITYF